MLRPSAGETLRAWLLSALVVHGAVAGNPDAKRLYDDLLSNYNKLVRPVVNTSDVLRVCIKLKLSQLIDVLPVKAGIPYEFEEEIGVDKKHALEKEKDILSHWSSDQTSGAPDVEAGRLFPYAPYVKTYGGTWRPHHPVVFHCNQPPNPKVLCDPCRWGAWYKGVVPLTEPRGYVAPSPSIHSSLTESFLSKNLEKKLDKMSVLEEGGRKSKLISNSLEVGSTRRKHTRSPHGLKPRRKSHKVNRSEGLSSKIRDVDSTREFKKILENFRIIGEEDLDESNMGWKELRSIVPAYFVLKLAEDSQKKSVKRSRLATSESLKLVFANDNLENPLPEKLKKSRPSGKMRDKINQTNDDDEKPTPEDHPKDLEPKFKDKETSVGCFVCWKMEQEFKFQREFNAGLLEQIKNVLQQLTIMTGVLRDILNNKSDRNNIKQHFLRNLSKINESNEEISAFNLDLTDVAYGCRIRKSFDPVYMDNGYNEAYDSVGMFKNDFESIEEDVSALFSPRKYDIYTSLEADSDRIRKTHPGRNIESAVFDVTSKCCCQIKRCRRREGGLLSLARKPNTDNLKKALLEENNYEANSPRAEGDQRVERKDLNVDEDEEDGGYTDSCNEMEADCSKTEMAGDMKKLGRGATSNGSNKMKILREKQLRLSFNEGDDESNGNDCLVYSNEDFANKLSSRASSRRNLKNQIMTTNLWVEQSWYDYKLRWDPKEYGGVHMLHVPSDHIWRPDIVLYNNADGNYEVTLMTKARVSHTGLVEWQPPAVYKSSCAIDVEFFPYDIQTCVLKLGSWTYDGFKVDLRHMDEKAGSNVVEVGVDLSEFYMSVEWDILEVPAVRNEKFYTCCDEPYLDITFNITMRRKTLFYTVNIIIPCMGISFLTVLTFYLPSDSGEKVTLSISILISLHVFFLLVVEIIPPTSLVVPLLGKYLIFAMILVSISICVTVVVLNVHFRSPQTHRMAPWVKRVFIHILPRLLVMRRPQYHFEPHRFMSRRVIMQTVKGKEIQTSYYPYPYQASAPAEKPKMRDIDSIITRQRAISKEDFSPESLADGEPVFGGSCQIHGPPPQSESEELSLSGVEAGVNDGEDLKSPTIKNPAFSHSMCPPEVHKSCFCVRFIAEHTKMLEDSTKVKEDWKYVAMVLDRLFLWIFTLAVLVGTAGIILQAPTLYDDRIPIDKQFAEIQTSTVIRCPPQ